MSDSCLFCRIVDGSVPATRVYEDETSIAFLDLYPVTPGHVLVIPRKHSIALHDAEPETLANLLPSIQRVARGLCHALQVEGFNLKQNNGSVAGQVIPHLHFHLIPRRIEDGLTHWPSSASDAADQEVLAARIAASIHATSPEV